MPMLELESDSSLKLCRYLDPHLFETDFWIFGAMYLVCKTQCHVYQLKQNGIRFVKRRPAFSVKLEPFLKLRAQISINDQDNSTYQITDLSRFILKKRVSCAIQ